jgi:hypothetical protein
MRPRHHLVLLGLLVAACSPEGAQADAATFGQTFTPTLSCNDPGYRDAVFQEDSGSGPTYRISGDGTLTSWSHLAAAGAEGDRIKLKVARIEVVSTGYAYRVVTETPWQPVIPGVLNTFPANIRVEGYDIIGMTMSLGPRPCTADFGDESRPFYANGDPEPGRLMNPFTWGKRGERIDLSVQVDLDPVAPIDTCEPPRSCPSPRTGTAEVEPPGIFGRVVRTAVVPANGLLALAKPKIDCPGEGPDCLVTTTATTSVVTASRPRRRKTVKVGGSRFTATPDSSPGVKVKLTRSGSRLLRKLKTMRTRIVVAVVRGEEKTSQAYTVTLRPKRVARK